MSTSVSEIKKGEIWVYRNKDNIVNRILYVINPSWSTTETRCWITDWINDCQVEYLKYKKFDVVFYRKDDILNDPHWELIDSLEAFRWICSLYADLCAIKQEKAVCEEDTQSKISEYQQIVKECRQAINAHNEAIESYKKQLSELLNENKKTKR